MTAAWTDVAGTAESPVRTSTSSSKREATSVTALPATAAAASPASAGGTTRVVGSAGCSSAPAAADSASVSSRVRTSASFLSCQ